MRVMPPLNDYMSLSIFARLCCALIGIFPVMQSTEVIVDCITGIMQLLCNLPR